MTPKFKIGLTFKRQNKKHPREETIIDIWTTTNSKGEVVQIRYVTEHEFLGQKVKDRDVVETTIVRSLFK